MALLRTSPSSPILLPPIASGIASPAAVALQYGAAAWLDPSSTLSMGSLSETVSSPASTSYTTAVSYTGSGYLEFLAWWGTYNNPAGGTCSVKLTIDGVVVFSDVSANPEFIKCAIGSVSRTTSTNTAGTASVSLVACPGRIPFRASVLIEHKYGTSSGGAVAYKLVKTG